MLICHMFKKSKALKLLIFIVTKKLLISFKLSLIGKQFGSRLFTFIKLHLFISFALNNNLLLQLIKEQSM